MMNAAEEPDGEAELPAQEWGTSDRDPGDCRAKSSDRSYCAAGTGFSADHIK
jgi:hypothetical protein